MVVHQFALTVSALLVGVVSGVTFTAEFEKTLESQLAKIKQDLEAYPDLQSVVEGVPQDVAGWKALSLEETLAKLRLFSDQKADEMPFLYALDRENTAKLTAFATDGHELVMQITDFLASDSGEASLVPLEGASGAAAPANAPITAPAAALPASGASPGPVNSPVSPSTSTTISVSAPASQPGATTSASGSSKAVSSPVAVNVPGAATSASVSSPVAVNAAGAASSASVSVLVGVKSTEASPTASSTNVAASALSLSTTDLFAETNSTGSSSADGTNAESSDVSADDVGVRGNHSAAALSDTVVPLPAAESSAARSVLSVVAATAVAMAVAVVM